MLAGDVPLEGCQSGLPGWGGSTSCWPPPRYSCPMFQSGSVTAPPDVRAPAPRRHTPQLRNDAPDSLAPCRTASRVPREAVRGGASRA
eukprot:1701883-Alexandrium_andersonii.AAC.1